MAGNYLIKYFTQHGGFETKPNGEADVCCPFPHGADGHLEKNPSAHINVDKAVFHCKTCKAEGRFGNGGLSETDFYAKINNVDYDDAIRILAELYNNDKTYNKKSASDLLFANAENMDFLHKRGLTDETIKKYELGSTGAGINYIVEVYGELLDVRIYNPNWKEEGAAKIKSEKGARPLLYPFDHWLTDPSPVTFLLAGENDTLLARQHGFNAITTTMGEGSFPKLFKGYFKNKRVIVCYDCDEAGRMATRRVAFLLSEAGADVLVMDLGLPGTKDDKDVTDFFVKHGKTAADFQALADKAVPFTEDDIKVEKDKEYTLIDLWEVERGEHTNQRRSSRVLNMGKIDAVMETPTVVEWGCAAYDLENAACLACNKQRESGHWILEEDNLKEVLELVECKEDVQKKNLKRFIGVPSKCPGLHLTTRARKPVQKVVFSPDVESESEMAGYQQAEHIGYVIGTDNLEDGQRYRAFYKKYPHPIRGQEVVLVVDRLETSDNALNTFILTPEIAAELDTMFKGSPKFVMQRRYEMVQKLVGKFAPRNVVESVDLIYHSVLDFIFGDRMHKGHPEFLIVGDTRTGKSDVSKSMMNFYGVGNYTELKNGSLAGLLGGGEKLSNGSFRLKWGKIPRNHKGLLILDELNGLPQGVMGQLTGLRSEREAVVEKIVSGKAPAKTRMLWISNPQDQPDGSSKIIDEYPNGITVVRELIGAEQDVARFDAIVLVPGSPASAMISPLTKEKLEENHNSAYRNLIYWVWTRTPDQVKFAPKVEEYIWTISMELNEQYDTKVKLFGTEAWKKLARLSISVAGCCFSHSEDYSSIVVHKEHVDWARDFLLRCYINDTFRLPEYVEQEKSVTETNPEINALVATLVQQHPMIMKTLHKSISSSLRMLQAASGLDQKDFNKVFTVLVRNNLVVTSRDNVEATRRLRNAFKVWLKDHEEYKMSTIAEREDAAL